MYTWAVGVARAPGRSIEPSSRHRDADRSRPAISPRERSFAGLQASVGNQAVQRAAILDGLTELVGDALDAARVAGAISADLLGVIAAQRNASTVARGMKAAGIPQADQMAAALAFSAGLRSEVELTDIVFKIRHPDRATKKLVPGDPADKALIKEWVGIRRSVVRPLVLLARTGALGALASAQVMTAGRPGADDTARSVTTTRRATTSHDDTARVSGSIPGVDDASRVTATRAAGGDDVARGGEGVAQPDLDDSSSPKRP